MALAGIGELGAKRRFQRPCNPALATVLLLFLVVRVIE